MAHTYTSLLYHLIWSTKAREPSITPALKPKLLAYLGGIVTNLRGRFLIANGTADHVHLLVLLPANISVADAVRTLKANASGWVHQEWPELASFAWQTGYGAFSVSLSNRDAVYQYIANQEDHHRTRTFQEEFVAFLNKHGIEFDERYIWE